MLRLSDLAEVGRKVRQDNWDDLGQASQEAAGDAIDDGREEEAKALAQYTIPEGKALHDLFATGYGIYLPKSPNDMVKKNCTRCCAEPRAGG